jgi:hypothetical protein
VDYIEAERILKANPSVPTGCTGGPRKTSMRQGILKGWYKNGITSERRRKFVCGGQSTKVDGKELLFVEFRHAVGDKKSEESG